MSILLTRPTAAGGGFLNEHTTKRCGVYERNQAPAAVEQHEGFNCHGGSRSGIDRPGSQFCDSSGCVDDPSQSRFPIYRDTHTDPKRQGARPENNFGIRYGVFRNHHGVTVGDVSSLKSGPEHERSSGSAFRCDHGPNRGVLTHHVVSGVA